MPRTFSLLCGIAVLALLLGAAHALSATFVSPSPLIKLELWADQSTVTVRALLLVWSFSAADRTAAQSSQVRDLAKSYDAGVLYLSEFDVDDQPSSGEPNWRVTPNTYLAGIITGLNVLANSTSHPELAFTPWIVWGTVDTGRWAAETAIAARQRVITAIFVDSLNPTAVALVSQPLLIPPQLLVDTRIPVLVLGYQEAHSYSAFIYDILGPIQNLQQGATLFAPWSGGMVRNRGADLAASYIADAAPGGILELWLDAILPLRAASLAQWDGSAPPALTNVSYWNGWVGFFGSYSFDDVEPVAIESNYSVVCAACRVCTRVMDFANTSWLPSREYGSDWAAFFSADPNNNGSYGVQCFPNVTPSPSQPPSSTNSGAAEHAPLVLLLLVATLFSMAFVQF